MRSSIEPCYSELVAEFASPQDLAIAAVGGDPAALAAYLDALKARSMARREHFGATLGIEILAVASGKVTMRMAWRPELRRGGGIFHGGALMALADHVAGCVFNTDPRIAASGSTGLTTDFNASFLRAAEPGEAVLGAGRVLRRGRNVTFMQIDITGETSGHTLVVCRTTYMTVARSSLPASGQGEPPPAK
jgi:1,4-dihydroxy-2-naphthoyl-CoA hydrolase